MEDTQIIALYWQRNPAAIGETDKKYGPYCFSIAYNLLENHEDSEECVQDTYLDAWNAMPPHRPGKLPAFLGKLTRSIAIDRYRREHARKRGGDQVRLALDELQWCVADSRSLEEEWQRRALIDTLNRFLAALPPVQRRIFLRRYWALASTEEIAVDFGYSRTKVSSMLLRLRKKLRAALEKEGLL